MGQYKVPQDIEAEDKIIGPLTLKQFIYAIIGAFWGGLCFIALRKVPVFMIVFGAPPTLLFFLLAFYKRDGQDFEQYLTALAGYFGESRQRLWIKEPVAEAFTLVPPPITTTQSQRNPAEVRSQLDHLANVMDAHGSANPLQQANDDRLLMPAQPASQGHVAAGDEVDILDPQLGSSIDVLGQLIDQAAKQRRTAAVQQVQAQAAQPQKTHSKAPASTSSTSVMTPPVSGDIIRLATENNDLKVSQIAAQANRLAPLVEGQTVNLDNAASQSR